MAVNLSGSVDAGDVRVDINDLNKAQPFAVIQIGPVRFLVSGRGEQCAKQVLAIATKLVDGAVKLLPPDGRTPSHVDAQRMDATIRLLESR